VTAQGYARTQYRPAIERKNLMGAEMALREMGAVALDEALDYVALLTELRPGHLVRRARPCGRRSCRRCGLAVNSQTGSAINHFSDARDVPINRECPQLMAPGPTISPWSFWQPWTGHGATWRYAVLGCPN
jgi:hypothetical protein